MAEAEEQASEENTATRPLGSLFGPTAPEQVREEPKDHPAESQPSEEKGEVEAKPETPSVEEKEPERKAAVVEEEEEKTAEPDWDSDSNPYRERFRKTQSAKDRIERETQELRKQVERLQKQVDGTYDPDTDMQQEQERLQAEIQARAQTSKLVAIERYGEDVVNQAQEWFDTTYANDIGMQQRILYSQAPFIEAIKLKEEQDFFSQYGRPQEAIKNIRKEVEAELRESLKDEIRADLLKKGKDLREVAPSISDVQGSSAPREKVVPGPKPLGKMFRLGG